MKEHHNYEIMLLGRRIGDRKASKSTKRIWSPNLVEMDFAQLSSEGVLDLYRE